MTEIMLVKCIAVPINANRNGPINTGLFKHNYTRPNVATNNQEDAAQQSKKQSQTMSTGLFTTNSR